MVDAYHILLCLGPSRRNRLGHAKYPVTRYPLPFPCPRVYVTRNNKGHLCRRTFAPRGLVVSSPKAAQTAVEPPSKKMDGSPVTPPTKHSHFHSSLNSSALSSSLRKERGAIAAQVSPLRTGRHLVALLSPISNSVQACDTCRSRKQRCDEQRPKCGTCQRFRLECNYREPQPTKYATCPASCWGQQLTASQER